MTANLNERQIAIFIAIAALEGEATLNELVKITNSNLSVQSIRNILSELNKLGLVTSERGLGARDVFNIGFLKKKVEKKEALYILKKDFEEILKEHPEILVWSKKKLDADSVDSLKEGLKKIKSLFNNPEKVESINNVIKKLKEEDEETTELSLKEDGLNFSVPRAALLEFIEEMEKRKKLKKEEDNG